MESNPFNILQSSVLNSMARKVGISIEEIIDVDDIPDRVEHDADLAAHGGQANALELDSDLAGQNKNPCDSSDGDNTPRGGNLDEKVSRLLKLEENWSVVVRKSRGKHPRKLFP